MKEIKKFKTITKEGFSIANLQRFPSREWGDEGGFQADLLLDNKKIAQVYQAGDGGEANVYFESIVSQEQKEEINAKVISFLKRYDYFYKENSPYDFLKNRTARDVGSSEIESLVNDIEEEERIFKSALKRFKNPEVKAVANITYVDSKGYPTTYLQSLSVVPDNDLLRATHLKQMSEQLNVPQERTTIHYIVDCEFHII